MVGNGRGFARGKTFLFPIFCMTSIIMKDLRKALISPTMFHYLLDVDRALPGVFTVF